MEPNEWYRSSAIKREDDNVYFVVTRAHEWDKGQYLCENHPYAEVLLLLRPPFWEWISNIFGTDKLSVEETTTILEGHGFPLNEGIDDFLDDWLDEYLEID